jgi:hypothetical protein
MLGNVRNDDGSEARDNEMSVMLKSFHSLTRLASVMHTNHF